jgi:hypothetical protein
MTNEDRVSLHELIPRDETLPAEVKDGDVSIITSILLRTVWGWNYYNSRTRAQAEYYNSVSAVADSIHRLNESLYRLGTVKPRIIREAEKEQSDHETYLLEQRARQAKLEYEIAQTERAHALLHKKHDLEAGHLDEQLSALEKKKTSAQRKNKSDDGITKKEREANEAARRYLVGLTKIKPKLDEADRIVDELIAQKTISEEDADEAREELRGIFTEGFLKQ